MNIEERISRLEAIEEIRYLQAKYQRCLDSRDFDSLAECFCDDAKASYDSANMSYDGKDAIVKFLASVMIYEMPSTHLIHGGEIDYIDKYNAKAKWILEDHLVHQKFLMKLHGAAVYYVEYKNIDNKWYISSIGYERYYQYFEFRGLLNILTLGKKKVLKNVKNANPEELGEYGRYYQYETLRKKKKK